jgi:competence protein ComEA
MPDPTEPTATSGLPYELARPLPPRTWRDRLDDALAGGGGGGGGGLGAGRLVAAAGALAVAAVVGWRLLTPPAPPPEMDIPFAEQGVAATGDRSTDAASAADGAASAPAAPGEGGPGAPAGSTGASGAPGAAAGDEVVVHVVGAVVAPGVQRLPAGSRVVDAVDAAGGALGDADLGRVNLAGLLTDGQQVYVLRQGEAPPPPPAGAGSDTDGGAAGGLVDINQASADQLDELPGVGPATAAAIIAHREQHGPFASVDDLIDVRGIGEAKLEQLRDLATV